MKLRLPLPLLCALLTLTSAICTQAAEVALTSNPTIWNSESAPTHRDGDWYSADGIVWKIESGNYNLHCDSFRYIGSPVNSVFIISREEHVAIEMSNGAQLEVNERATVNVSVLSDVSSASLPANPAYDYSEQYTSMYSDRYGSESSGVLGGSILNNGTVSINSSASYTYDGGTLLYGEAFAYATTAEVTNSGTLCMTATATAQDASSDTGGNRSLLAQSYTGTSLHNTGYASITSIAQAVDSQEYWVGSNTAWAYGGISGVNEGELEVLVKAEADFYTRAYGIKSFTNTSTGTMTVEVSAQATHPHGTGCIGDALALGIEGDLDNDGRISVSVSTLTDATNDMGPSNVAQGFQGNVLQNSGVAEFYIQAINSDRYNYGGGALAEGLSKATEGETVLTNSGTLTIETLSDVSGLGPYVQGESCGIKRLNGITNTDILNIKAVANTSADACRASTQARGISDSGIDNNGGALTISAESTLTGTLAYDEYAETPNHQTLAEGIHIGWDASSRTISNTGSITVSAKAESFCAYEQDMEHWIYARGIHFSPNYDGNGATLENSGTLNITAAAVSDCVVKGVDVKAEGISLTASEMVNSGTLNILSSADAYLFPSAAYGISLNASTAFNYSGGQIKASVSGNARTNLIGIVLDNASTFYNSGTIASDLLRLQDTSSRFFLLNGAMLAADTPGATQLMGGDGTVYLGGKLEENNALSEIPGGSFCTANSALSLSGVTLQLADNTTLHMGGDFKVGADVTTVWNGYSLTIDNGGTRHAIEWKNEFAGSWSGSFSLSENDDGVKLVQNQVDRYISLNLGKVMVGGGILRASETLELGGGDTAMDIASDTGSLVLHGEHGGRIVNTVISADGLMMSSGEGQELTLDSSILTLGGGLNLLKNVVVMGSTQIKSEVGSSFSLNLVTFVLDSLNSSLGAQAVLAAEDDVALFLTPYTTGGTAIVGTNIFDNVTVSGDMTLDLSFWAEEINRQGYDSLAFSLGDGIAEGTQIRASLDGENYATATYGADNMVVFNVSDMPSTPSIPEPSTATLSLLALTGLIARRRRK